MRSSYKNSDINYGEIFELLNGVNRPFNILEIGILDGYSLENLAKNKNAKILAFDIFDEFNGNHASKEFILNKFQDYKNVKIEYGDFYELYKNFNNEFFNIIHIDIANCGSVYEFALEHYLPKLVPGGFLIMEGGSKERDNVEWMKKYNKKSIGLVLETKKNYITLGKIPSITIFQRELD